MGNAASARPVPSGQWREVVTENDISDFFEGKEINTLELLHGPDKKKQEFCALLSALSYTTKTQKCLREALLFHMSIAKEDFGEVKYCNVRPDPDQEATDNSNQPVASAVVGDILYIAWKGTADFLDVMKDLRAVPVECGLWSGALPNVKTHFGFEATIFSQFSIFPRLPFLIEKFQIKEVVFTGHSLGAGLAQVALLAVLGQKEVNFTHPLVKLGLDQEETKEILSGVKFSCIGFASPMVFSFKEHNLEKREKEVMDEFHQSCTIFVYDQDIVPHIPGNIDFWIAGARAAGAQVATERGLDSSLSGNALGKILGGIVGLSGAAATDTLLDFVNKLDKDPLRKNALQSFRHNAVLVHITKQEATALTHEDFLTGIPFDTSTSHQLLEMHTCLPKCFGSFMIQRRQVVAGRRSPVHVSYDQADYKGQMKDGMKHGHGVLLLQDETLYIGEFDHGLRHGQGTESYPSSGEWYQGEWKDDLKSGYGTYSWPSGAWYEGEWQDGERTGRGKLTKANGTVEEGKFWRGLWHGLYL